MSERILPKMECTRISGLNTSRINWELRVRLVRYYANPNFNKQAKTPNSLECIFYNCQALYAFRSFQELSNSDQVDLKQLFDVVGSIVSIHVPE
ncbi:unnamed protein product, partial [Cuscuta epithymum]